MRERLEIIIEELKVAMADVDKVEAGTYGYKAPHLEQEKPHSQQSRN